MLLLKGWNFTPNFVKLVIIYNMHYQLMLLLNCKHFKESSRPINILFVLGTSWSFWASFGKDVMLTLLEVLSTTVLHPRFSSEQYVECCPTRPGEVVRHWRECELLKVFPLATSVSRSRLLLMLWGSFACLLVAR